MSFNTAVLFVACAAVGFIGMVALFLGGHPAFAIICAVVTSWVVSIIREETL